MRRSHKVFAYLFIILTVMLSCKQRNDDSSIAYSGEEASEKASSKLFQCEIISLSRGGAAPVIVKCKDDQNKERNGYLLSEQLCC